MKKLCFLFTSFIFSNVLFAQWSNDATIGTIAANAITTENYQVSVSDGSNGSIIVFESKDNNNVYNLYAQRINGNGQLQWGLSNNPKPVCVINSEKYLDNVMPDGSGGVYITWFDYRSGEENADIYMQHINSNGDAVWAANGIILNSNTGRSADEVRMCTDGGTGVIVTWAESVYDDNIELTTYSQVFVQKFNSSGAPQWSTDGIEISNVESLRGGASIVQDGSGGAIICFADTRNSGIDANNVYDNIDIYAQRISSSGVLMWTDSGKPLNTSPNNQFIFGEYLQANASVPDGAGGVIVLFDDYVGDNTGNSNFYAQHLNASGAIQWSSAGVAVCTSGKPKILIGAFKDGAGGLVTFWNEDRTESSVYGVYAQRILANGTANWNADGVKYVDEIAGYIGIGNSSVDDGNGNYIFSWTDVNNNLKAQKINNNGVIQWGVTHKDICTHPGSYPVLPGLVLSDAGSTLGTWLDDRDYTNSSTDIYAAKLDDNGYLVGAPSATAYITVANGNWDVGSTWQGGVVPPANADVTVRHTVSVTANATCHSVRIEKPNGNLTVNTGISLNILQ